MEERSVFLSQSFIPGGHVSFFRQVELLPSDRSQQQLLLASTAQYWPRDFDPGILR